MKKARLWKSEKFDFSIFFWCLNFREQGFATLCIQQYFHRPLYVQFDVFRFITFDYIKTYFRKFVGFRQSHFFDHKKNL